MVSNPISLYESFKLVGGGTPKTSNEDYWGGNIPWLSVVDFNTGNKFVYKTEKTITEDGLNNSSTKLLDAGDVIISARGTVGVVSMLKSSMAFNQSCYGIKEIPGTSHNHYLYYLLKDAVRKLKQISHGGVFDTITTDTFKEILIDLPSLNEQKAIAEVLSSLDDKIDLLHRQNKTLESMAEALFRHHFIDNAQADWEEKPLDSIAEYLNGLACQKFPVVNEHEKLPVLKIKDLRAGGFSDSSDWATSTVNEKYIIEPGDVIFSWSGSLMLKVWDGDKCVLNQHLFKVTPIEQPEWFVYFWTKHYMEKFIGIAEDKATTMGHIKRSDLSSSIAKIAPPSYMSSIDKAVTPLYEKLKINSKQIRTLEQLRDTLLPKIMSGEVRVRYEEAS